MVMATRGSGAVPREWTGIRWEAEASIEHGIGLPGLWPTRVRVKHGGAALADAAQSP